MEAGAFVDQNPDGMKEASEFPRLLAIYNHYPLEELIVHRECARTIIRGNTDGVICVCAGAEPLPGQL